MNSIKPLIFVVEDEPSLRRDLLEELQEAGYRTLAAEDGHAAKSLLAEHKPDLVLCDITMPKLDGYGLLTAIRAEHPDLAATPFVFLTAMSEPQEVIEGKLQGADDYLVKPVDYDLLLATISARLRQVDRIRGQHDTEIDSLRTALKGLSSDGSQQVLELITLGVVLLDGKGRVLHANRAARDMADDAAFFSFQHGTPHATTSLDDTSLWQAISDRIQAATDASEKISGVTLSGKEQLLSVLVCSLTPSPANDTTQPHVALFLSPPAQAKKVSEKLLITLFDLTPTEARVAAILTRGARAAEVAEELGVSQTTIAFHIRNLLQKTGTNRQIDLIALILAGPMAVGSA